MISLSLPLLLISIASQSPAAPSPQEKNLRGADEGLVPASAGLYWEDFDGDGLLDAFVLASDSGGHLLRNVGDGSFDDVTLDAGLRGVADTAIQAAWADYDGDGRRDLFLASFCCKSRLMRQNESAGFEDITQLSGLPEVTEVLSSRWIQLDETGLPALQMTTLGGDRFFRNVGGIFTEFDFGVAPTITSPLFPFATRTTLPGPAATEPGTPTDPSEEPASAPEDRSNGRDGGQRVSQVAPSDPGVAETSGHSGPKSGGPGPIYSEVIPLVATACAVSVRDVTTGDCLRVDTTPTFGRILPLGNEFFVDPSGDTGIGTTSPQAKLDVSGRVRAEELQLTSGASAGAVLTSDGSGLASWGAIADQWVDTTGDTMTGELELNPGAGNAALDIASGHVEKGGALFLHNNGEKNLGLGTDALGQIVTSGFNEARFNVAIGHQALFSAETNRECTAVGYQALASVTGTSGLTAFGSRALALNTTGGTNSAFGAQALLDNTTGSGNSAFGHGALENNTTGGGNVAVGKSALFVNKTGSDNVAIGEMVMFNATGSRNVAVGSRSCDLLDAGTDNTAVGYLSLKENEVGSGNTGVGASALLHTIGSSNTALGDGAGRDVYNGSNNIHIANDGLATDTDTIKIGTPGTQTTAFIAGITGVTPAGPSMHVVIDANGQLGTVMSSRRFKEDIRGMGDASDAILKLRPVLFRYKARSVDGNGPTEYGLIAEEVAEVFPDLVIYDDEGKPLTVKYDLLSTILLNEFQKSLARNEVRDDELEELRASLRDLERRLEAAESH